jgi:16S rRNA (adenine1518-N6/adenine1519-N6)-dimethyltransferase
MRRNDVTDLGCNEALFKTVVKTTFGQRRKTLRNSLRGLLPAVATIPESAEALVALRPEQLSVAQFIQLTNIVSNLRSKAQ